MSTLVAEPPVTQKVVRVRTRDRTPEPADPRLERREPGDIRKKGYALLTGVYRDVGFITLHLICGERHSQTGPESAYLEGDILDLRISSKHSFARMNRGLVFVSKIRDSYYFPGIFEYHRDHSGNKKWLELGLEIDKEVPEDPGEIPHVITKLAELAGERHVCRREALVDFVLSVTQSDQDRGEIERMIDETDLFHTSQHFYIPEMRASIFPPVEMVDWQNAEDLAWLSLVRHRDVPGLQGLDLPEQATLNEIAEKFLRYTHHPPLFRFIAPADLPEKLRKFEMLADHLDVVAEV